MKVSTGQGDGEPPAGRFGGSRARDQHLRRSGVAPFGLAQIRRDLSIPSSASSNDPVHVQDRHRPAGNQGLRYQRPGVGGVTERRIENRERLALHGGERDRGRLPRGIASCRKDHAALCVCRRNGQHAPEQLVANPRGCRMHGHLEPRPILVIQIEQGGGVVRVQNIAEAPGVLGKVMLRRGSQFARHGFPRGLSFRVRKNREIVRCGRGFRIGHSG